MSEPVSSLWTAASIRRVRPAKNPVDPWQIVDLTIEPERRLDEAIVTTATLFLGGAECPFTCVFCDLWKFTLDHPSSEGAIHRQVEEGLRRLATRQEIDQPHSQEAIANFKLYNASNFFVDQAVSIQDREMIAATLKEAPQVTVECHPRLIDDSVFDFQSQLSGQLEVAMGLETVAPQALPKLGKEMTLDDFDRASEKLLEHRVDVRAFALVGVPYLAPVKVSHAEKQEIELQWIERTVDHAVSVGVSRISLIPVRSSNGVMEQLQETGEWLPPTLGLLEAALERNLDRGEIVVTADLWDLRQFSNCGHCYDARRERLASMNLSGCVEPAIECAFCRRDGVTNT